MTSTGEAVFFWILGPLMVIAALGLLFAKKAVHAAICVALVMVILGVFYIVQGAEFLGIVQVFVYTGAVMMLFLFVLMLVGVDSSDSLVETIKGQRRPARPVLRPRRPAVRRDRLGHPAGPEVPDAVNEDPGNVTGIADADLRQVRLGLRGHQRPADHRRARRDGAGAPRAAGREGHPAGGSQRRFRRARARPGRPARPRRLRAAQRGRHPGPAARRHAGRGCRSPACCTSRAQNLRPTTYEEATARSSARSRRGAQR